MEEHEFNPVMPAYLNYCKKCGMSKLFYLDKGKIHTCIGKKIVGVKNGKTK